MVNAVPAFDQKGSAVSRQRILKLAIVIGLHAALVGLLLYVSFNDSNENLENPSIKVSILKSSESTQSSSSQQVSKPALGKPSHHQVTKYQSASHTEAPIPIPPEKAMPNAASEIAHAPVAAASPEAKKEENLLAHTDSPAPTSSAPTVGADCPDRPTPAYPDASNGRREKGEVQLSISITPKGEINSVEIKKSSGSSLLDEAARDTVIGKWHCIAAQQNGKYVAAKVGVLIQFVPK